jgi:glycine cleavage system H protein
MSDTEVPENLLYTPEHEWAQLEAGRVRVGITAYAQAALGDIVYVNLPEVGAAVCQGRACGEVESTKSVSDLYSPVSGTVIAFNDRLDGEPELVNSDPYGQGWMFEVELGNDGERAQLLTPDQYRTRLG